MSSALGPKPSCGRGEDNDNYNYLRVLQCKSNGYILSTVFRLKWIMLRPPKTKTSTAYHIGNSTY